MSAQIMVEYFWAFVLMWAGGVLGAVCSHVFLFFKVMKDMSELSQGRTFLNFLVTTIFSMIAVVGFMLTIASLICSLIMATTGA